MCPAGVSTMAKRKNSITRRVRYAARRVTRRSRSGGRGGFLNGLMGDFVAGVAANVGAQVGTRFLGTYGSPLAYGGVGYFMKNPTLMTLAGVQAGALLPVSGFLGGSSNGSSGAI